MEGDGYIVSWCIGHLVELAQPGMYKEEWKKWDYGSLPIIPKQWKYTVKENTRKQYGILCSLLNRDDVETVICATDVGRILRTFKIKKNVEVTDNGKDDF